MSPERRSPTPGWARRAVARIRVPLGDITKGRFGFVFLLSKVDKVHMTSGLTDGFVA